MNDIEEPETIENAAPGGIQALDAALAVLQALSVQPGPIGVSGLARAAKMPVSKVHRYLASFVHAGLAVQSGRSGRYALGPFAARLGLAALARNDFVNRAADQLEDLCQETGLTALLTVWANQGATVVRWERAASPVATSFGLGSTLPLLTSASGRIFLAFLPARLTEAALAAELARAAAGKVEWPDFEPSREGVTKLIRSVRERRIATVDGHYVPGLRAIGAPILDWQGEAQAAVTLIGTSEAVIEENGPAERALAAFVSARAITSPI